MQLVDTERGETIDGASLSKAQPILDSDDQWGEQLHWFVPGAAITMQ